MRKTSLGFVASFLLASSLFACDDGVPTTVSATGGAASGTGGTGTGGSLTGLGGALDSSTLAGKYAATFPIGVAISNWHLDNVESIIASDFNHLTAENAMKIADIHPGENTWNTADADRIADYARAHGMKMTGHALLWHRQAPAWMFEGLTPLDSGSIETLKGRLKAHIDAMIERYADVVDNWDVVNEAISDSSGKTYRDGTENSQWYEIFGSEEYIYWAFQYAHDALEAKEPGSSAGKLYYNEYTVTVKTDKILTLLGYLKGKGIEVAGVGFQSHENLSWPSTADLQKSFDAFVNAGYKIKISELDITIYSDYSTGSFVPEAQKTFDAALETTQATRFGSLFELYRKNKANITSVTFWGVSDDNTWLDNEPVAGRNDFPLLYDDAHEPKDARATIMNF
jgi:endo-1,4-beta-xylanase